MSDLKSLPKMPTVRTGVRPPGQNEKLLESVQKTDPQKYMKLIKELLCEIKDYRECLGYLGYTLNGLNIDRSQVYAKKEIIHY